jgi:uncharacterized protein (TIGR02996 family)
VYDHATPALHREPPMSSTRAALEAALAADPDDLARHAAYADLLIEEGDSRGEFIRLQLALEDPDLPADSRKAMDEAVAELLRLHEAEWLGPLASYVEIHRAVQDGDYADGIFVDWQRGWIHTFQMSNVTFEMLEAVDRAPILKLVRHGYLFGLSDTLPDSELTAILRRFTKWPVTSLHIHDGMGDDVAVALVASDILDRLQCLDVRGCQLSDDGAIILARHPAIAKLDNLLASGNWFTPIGLDALAEVGHTDLGGSQLWDHEPPRRGVYV